MEHKKMCIFLQVRFIASAMFFSLKEKKAFGNKSEQFPETFLLVKISVVQFDPNSGDTVYVSLSPCLPIR